MSTTSPVAIMNTMPNESNDQVTYLYPPVPRSNGRPSASPLSNTSTLSSSSSRPIPLPQRPGFGPRNSLSNSFSARSPFARSLRPGSFGLGFPVMGSYEETMHRTGSWKGKFVGSEVGFPWQAGGVDTHDFSMHLSTSIDSTQDSSSKLDNREADYCQNYNCCGQELSSMHDLLEHYEDCHVIILPSPSAPHRDLLDMEFDDSPSSGSSSSSSSFSAGSSSTQAATTSPTYTLTTPITNRSPSLEDASPPFKKRTPIPASAPLQLSDVLASAGNSAFETSILSPFPSNSSHALSPSVSSPSVSPSFYASPVPSSVNEKKTKQALAARAAFVNGGRGGSTMRTDRWHYPSDDQTLGHADILWEGEYKFPPPTISGDARTEGKAGLDTTLLFSSMPQQTKTPASSPHSTATQLGKRSTPNSFSVQGQHSKVQDETNTAAPSTLLAIPPPPPSSNQKLYHCPTPGCNKSYKQQNGLKYHLKVGQCDFNVRDGVENGLSEEQAEEKSRPYQCQVGGGCWKRYRQMNGLRYHYLNSGAHGAIGLALIQQGKHINPKGGTLPSTMGASAQGNSKPTPSSSASSPSASPNPNQSQSPIGFTSLAALCTVPGSALNNADQPIARPGNWPLNSLAPELQQRILQQQQHGPSPIRAEEEMLWSVDEGVEADADGDGEAVADEDVDMN
ncbi:zinc finger protein sfp1 [Phaffia rhodozyma]|uniref:Zinc finger protein sfp1 n=1 Tax=Phaffia rhodozyma TaxID=264483 RepID=A0A0F7SER3_PHARH|nr:zinc finger protein sfp1 [Phaffia rhodozyma]